MAEVSIAMESCVKDAAVQRRMIFATLFLPPELPKYWETIATFASTIKSGESITPESAKLAMENTQVLSAEAFISDIDLTRQLIGMECNSTKKPLGIPLIPNQTHCTSCGGRLILKGDRPSRISLYTESLGTIPGTHFHKYCQKYRTGCRFVQYYGYQKAGNEHGQYNTDWDTLPYFVSSQETGFEMKLLKQFDAELLIGQVSYNQKADIYNVVKGYDTAKKVSSTRETERSVYKPPVHGYEHPCPLKCWFYQVF